MKSRLPQMNPLERSVSAPSAEPKEFQPWQDAFSAPRLAVLISLLIFVMFPGVVIGTHSFFNGDFGLFTYPNAVFTRSSFWSGQIPLWDPFNNCGIPFQAQWNTTVCYPLSSLFLLLPLPWSLNLFC